MDPVATTQALQPTFGHYAILITLGLLALNGLAANIAAKAAPPTTGFLGKIWPAVQVLARNVTYAENKLLPQEPTTPAAPQPPK